MSTELGAGAWSYFGDPRAIAHDGHTFTGWISTTGNVWVAHIRPDGQLHQAGHLQGPRGRRPQQPVARLPPRRAHRGVLQPALGPHPAAAEPAPEPDALPGLQEAVLDRRLRARPARQRPTCPAASATPTRTRSSSAASCGCSGAAAAGTRRSPTRATAATGCRRASCCVSHDRGAALLEVRRRRQDATSTASSPRATPTTSTTASTTCATRTSRLLRRSTGTGSGACATSRCRSRKLERIYKFTKAKGSAWPHDIALTVRGPAAHRLHAPRRQPRHVLLRATTTASAGSAA